MCAEVYMPPSFLSPLSLSLPLLFSFSRTLLSPPPGLFAAIEYTEWRTLRDGARGRIGSGQMERAFMPAIRA
jgi:hypothetical protein